ncbi:pyridoxamine 5'-phosphate oxidase family protein [Candidatus Woesebacteria bacterium]|nr:pyridoxamine 5'-phosphate oxidase family protein [Candidatus Woesebacteria bacterium]
MDTQDPVKRNKIELAYNFLRTQIIAHIATVSTANLPHIASVYYMCDAKLNFYFVTQMNTLKFNNLKFNPIISIEVTDESTLRTVQARGKAAVCTDQKESVSVINQISQIVRYNVLWTPPTILHNYNASATVIKFAPEWLRLADFREMTPKRIEEIFIPILP